MIASEPPAQPAIDLAASGIASTTLVPIEPIARLSRTRLRVLRQRTNVLRGGTVVVAGRLLAERGTASLAGRMITLQAFGRGGWHSLSHVRTERSGHYRLRFRARRTGSARLRVHFAGDAVDAPASWRLRRLNVYRLVEASWYGGGGSLACGGALTSSTLGVANRTLPCGTIVTLRYHGRSIRVPVVDRGPFVAGREFDLTEGTKQALGFGDTGVVWSTR